MAKGPPESRQPLVRLGADAEAQSQAVHHITLTGADRRAIRSTSGKAFSACPSSSSSRHRNADDISTDWTGLIRDLHQRGSRGDAEADADGSGLRPPPRIRRVERPSREPSSGSTSAASSTARSRTRGFMDSAIYFKDPLGLLIELASYRFVPPAGHTHADVLLAAHRDQGRRGDLATGSTSLMRSSSSPRPHENLGGPGAEEPLRLSAAAAVGSAPVQLSKPPPRPQTPQSARPGAICARW